VNVTNSALMPTFDWDFGDGTHSVEQYATHTYESPGNYTWSLKATVSGSTVSKSGTIEIGSPMRITEIISGENMTLSWPEATSDVVLESAPSLIGSWNWVTNAPVNNAVTLQIDKSSHYFRLRRPW
jgi:PKD repeat protein